MAKAKKKNRIYKVTVEGEYFKTEHQRGELHPYEETVRMDESHREAGFVWAWKNLMAPAWMPKKYPGYTNLHTHRLVSVVDEEDPDTIPNDPMLMSIDQLIAFIRHNELPVDIGLYPDEDALKQAVIDCIRDEEIFVEGQNRRKTVRGNAVELTNTLALLNEGVSMGLAGKAQNAKDIDPDLIPSTDEVKIPDQRNLSNPKTDDMEFDHVKKRADAENDDDEKPVKAKKKQKRDEVDDLDDEGF